MTGKERILTVLGGGIPDRVPVALFVQQEYLSYYFGRNNTCRVADAAALARKLGFDVFTRQHDHSEPHFLRKSYPNWAVEKKNYVEHGVANKVTVITTPQGTLTQREIAPYDPATIAGIHFTTAEYLLDQPEKFELFQKYLPQPDADYFEEMKQRAKWANNIVGDLGINCPWGTGGVYNAAAGLRSVEDLMCDPYEDETFYSELMNCLTGILVRDYEALAQTEYDCLGIQGNIANGGMLSLGFFEEFVLPYEKQICGACAAGKKFTLYHNCGYARGLYPAYKKLGITLFETLSPAPQGDNSLAEAKAELGDELVLAGNLDQINFLKTASPQEVAAATAQVVRTGMPGGKYIFATSDYLERGTPAENVRVMIEAAKEAGRYE